MNPQESHERSATVKPYRASVIRRSPGSRGRSSDLVFQGRFLSEAQTQQRIGAVSLNIVYVAARSKPKARLPGSVYPTRYVRLLASGSLSVVMATRTSIYGIHPDVETVQRAIVGLPAKTGRSLDEWIAVIRKHG